jgi:inorganic pyrophosphatase
MNAMQTDALVKPPGKGDDFWDFLDRLVSTNPLVLDRPKGSRHPRFPQWMYPLDYGYLEGTTSADGAGIDVWRGSCTGTALSAVILTVDLLKQDTELKLMLGCTPEEVQIALNFLNGSYMRAVVVHRPSAQ